MIFFEDTLRTLILSLNLVGERVYLARAPQQPSPRTANPNVLDTAAYDTAVYSVAGPVLPYVVYFHVAPNPHMTHNGPLGMYDRNYQISIFDSSQSRALAVADSIRNAFDGYAGNFEGVQIGAILFENQPEEQWEDDTRLFQIIQEYRMLYALPDASAKPVVPVRKPAVRSRRKHEYALR